MRFLLLKHTTNEFIIILKKVLFARSVCVIKTIKLRSKQNQCVTYPYQIS